MEGDVVIVKSITIPVDYAQVLARIMIGIESRGFLAVLEVLVSLTQMSWR